MSQHLSASDYRTMPWANGLGETIEIIRHDDAEGKLQWRLSMATVMEDGPFSIFADIERNLTVLTGTGFDLQEDITGLQYSAALLSPVAFAGDIAITAKNVKSPCQDFNVMTTRMLPKPRVWVLPLTKEHTVIKGENLALFALSSSIIKTSDRVFNLAKHELLLCKKSSTLEKGSLICIDLASAYDDDKFT